MPYRRPPVYRPQRINPAAVRASMLALAPDGAAAAAVERVLDGKRAGNETGETAPIRTQKPETNRETSARSKANDAAGRRAFKVAA